MSAQRPHYSLGGPSKGAAAPTAPPGSHGVVGHALPTHHQRPSHPHSSQHPTIPAHGSIHAPVVAGSSSALDGIKLHQRLALALFHDDCRQVLEWIETHGEGFLKKNMGVGRNLNKARALQKAHQHFESIAQNTYTNAEKLMAAAEELAQTGECNPEEINRVAHELRTRVQRFANRVEKRRQLLALTTMFYTHDKDLTVWFEELQDKSSKCTVDAPESVEACETAREQLVTQHDFMVDAINSTLREGETILEELRKCLTNSVVDPPSAELLPTSSITAIEASLERVNRIRTELEEVFKTKKYRLELCLQLRLFERDALNLSQQFDLWAEEVRRATQKNPLTGSAVDVASAEKLLQMHVDNFSRLQQIAYDLLSCGQELMTVLSESSGSNCLIMADHEQTAVQRIQLMLEFLHERETEIEEISEERRRGLEQYVQFCQLQSDANQVLGWIHNGESMLAASFNIPTSYTEAQELHVSHEQFQLAIEASIYFPFDIVHSIIDFRSVTTEE